MRVPAAALTYSKRRSASSCGVRPSSLRAVNGTVLMLTMSASRAA